MTSISIFIPVYNGAEYISDTLDSILAQWYRDFEVLCVDDNSTDNSYTILQQYARKDSRIKIYRKQNGGDVPHSWDYIIPKIVSDFTLYMSQDDLLEPNTLQKLIERQVETGADCVIPIVIWYTKGHPQENPHNHIGVNGNTQIILSGKEAFELMMDYSISGFGLWRSSIIKENPVKPLAYNSDEYSQRDWCTQCKKIAFSDAKFIYSQNNPNAITHLFTDKQIEASLTDAMVATRAAEIGIDRNVIIQYANDKYKRLWFHTMWFMMHRNALSIKRQNKLVSLFSKAHKGLSPFVTLNHWRYRISKENILFFWIIVLIKTLKAKYAKK